MATLAYAKQLSNGDRAVRNCLLAIYIVRMEVDVIALPIASWRRN
jgi:hypothetical protein